MHVTFTAIIQFFSCSGSYSWGYAYPRLGITDVKDIPYSKRRERLINVLKPTGHAMHQQFNIQQLYVLPTLYLRGVAIK